MTALSYVLDNISHQSGFQMLCSSVVYKLMKIRVKFIIRTLFSLYLRFNLQTCNQQSSPWSLLVCFWLSFNVQTTRMLLNFASNKVCNPSISNRHDHIISILGFISAARTYDVESKTNAPNKYTVRDELLSVGKKLFLLEDGKERYSVCELYSLSI